MGDFRNAALSVREFPTFHNECNAEQTEFAEQKSQTQMDYRPLENAVLSIRHRFYRRSSLTTSTVNGRCRARLLSAPRPNGVPPGSRLCSPPPALSPLPPAPTRRTVDVLKSHYMQIAAREGRGDFGLRIGNAVSLTRNCRGWQVLNGSSPVKAQS